MADFAPRPHQEEILAYTGGTMGISAVPGSGKTWTLSALAVKLITEGYLAEGQEILIVTLTNSAVDNFSSRINGFLVSADFRSLLPPFRVRTLHGLAHDIVRERPDLVGLDSNFTIIDERAADQILTNIASNWLQTNPYAMDGYLAPDLDEHRLEWVRREALPDLVKSIALAFIRTAKDTAVPHNKLSDHLAGLPVPLPLAEMGAELYTEYQRALAYRGSVDFDDLIRLGLQALNTDPAYLENLQSRWPFILEDEAQDSSQLQELILRSLVGDHGNWVRVGDPNQAIYESFTTANPRYLRAFMKTCAYPRQLPNSGRSTQSIIDLANFLIDWSRHAHPIPEVRDAMDEPFIEPTPPEDPQPNPPDDPHRIFLIPTAYTRDEELDAVVSSLERWLPDHLDQTVAVLVPRNKRGFDLVDRLQKQNIDVVDNLLRSTTVTRFTAGALANVLRYLGDPGNPRKLATVYEVWRRDDKDDSTLGAVITGVSRMLETCSRVEDFIWSRPGKDWLDALNLGNDQPEIHESLLLFREFIRRWQGTVLLPVNQIVLSLAQDLFDEPSELAIAHKLAVLLRQAERTNPDWRLQELVGELAVIARNERRFLGFSPDDLGFNPDNYKGQVVVATIHKAKGLEWDRVYLMSANNYDFPSGSERDRYLSERWFIRNQLNLEAEALAQLQAACSQNAHSWYQEGFPTQQARLDYIRERIRLFYVGVTRARKELIVTWNTGRGRGELQPATAFAEMRNYWEAYRNDTL